ncbi:SAM-dependent methyltransferase [Flavobacteriaceae bacterium 14752]|uniref:SAM-dependent methyltransferase n=1 Tax=Mesohalobacter salilacus TaxID=2491711 RepID=UPI000F634447|nr:SAM-dependent methyltransferase [Flavobacteriaceae bacterium 14752]
MGQKGQLYLIPTRLGDQPPLEVLPLSIRKKITDINYYIVENEKVARRFIKKIVPSKSQDKLEINLLNKFTQDIEIPEFLKPCEEGKDIGLMTDAGCPGIADPGSKVVSLAHRQNIKVVPLVGPSSIVLALMASGLNGQNFAFNGYLPIDKAECKKRVKQLEKHAEINNQTQIFIETPYRNGQLFETFLKTLKPQTRLCVAVDLTLTSEYIITKSVKEWQTENPDWHKRPAIFIFHP